MTARRTVVGGRLTIPLLIMLAVAASLAGLSVRPATGPARDTADYVVVAGAAGLRWDDIDPHRTPSLWKLASGGSIGWLSVRSADRTTCPGDGWLTLGAGNYAILDTARVAGQCPPLTPQVQRPDRIGADLPAQRLVVRENQDRRPYGTVPGSLAESVRCTVAVGAGAAVAAARPFGRVDRYEPALPADPAALLSSCVLSVVDLGTVAGEGAQRRLAAAQADATLAAVLAARPERSLVIVAGVADTDTTPRLHVAVADGPGWERGWLTSAGTGRDGYVRLVDLAPTVLTALGEGSPERIFAGRTASTVPGRSADLADAVAGGADADRRAAARRQVSDTFFTVLAGIQVLLFLLVMPLMVRARRHAGPTGPASPPRLLLDGMEVLLVASALAIPAAMLADATPWWRSGAPSPIFAAVALGVTVAGTAAVRALPRYRQTLWPMAAVAASGAAMVTVDLLTGARLQINGVTGYSAAAGGRYAGLGGVGLGVFAAGTLFASGCLAQAVRRRWRPVIVVLFGGFAVIMIGSPYLGADPTGAVAATAGVSVAAAMSAGGWLTFARFGWAAVAGIGISIGFAVLDLRRPPLEQGSLGRFVTALADGSGGPAVQRVATENVGVLLNSPITVLAMAGAVLLAFAHFSPWGGINRLFGLHPAIRAAAAGATVATVSGGLLSGSALVVAGAAAAVMVPMVAVTTLRVLDHAADRTRPEGTTDGPGGPGLLPRDSADPRTPVAVPAPAQSAPAQSAPAQSAPAQPAPPATAPPATAPPVAEVTDRAPS